MRSITEKYHFFPSVKRTNKRGYKEGSGEDREDPKGDKQRQKYLY